MNLKKLSALIQKEWSHIDFEIKKLTSDRLDMNCNIVAKNYFDDGVLCKLTAYTSGTMHITFTFDNLEPTMHSLDLINTFNDNSSWFSAYITNINDNNFLELHYSGIGSADEKEMSKIFTFVLNRLISDDTMEYLKPLTELTTSD